MASIEAQHLSRWFEAFGPALALFARQHLGAGPAEDIVQEVFLRLMSVPRRPENIKAWLFKAARNEAISRLRAIRRQRRHEVRQASQQQDWFLTQADDLIDAETVKSTLSSLPQEQREIIVLRIWAEMTFQEAADVIGEPVSTLFSRYRAGLASLRRALEASCETKTN